MPTDNDCPRRIKRAFTLIELLVVIAVIALLISILLPALRWARESGRTVVCMSNMKQIGSGLATYANDYKNRIWETGWIVPQRRYWYAQPQNPDLAPSAANPVIAGPAFEYLNDVDRIFGCPSNNRKTPTRDIAVFTDPFWSTPEGILQRELFNVFLTPRALSFDYTMLTGATGARVDSSTLVSWNTRCRTMTARDGAHNTQPNPNDLKPLRTLPVFVEEDILWWNAPGPDGMWSNWDQVTNRHARKGHMLFLDSTVELVQFPLGGDPNSQTLDTGDFTANDIWAKGKFNVWYQVAPSWPATARPYGWFDLPRP